MVLTYLFQQREQFGQALADNVGVAADAHKIGVSVPSRDEVDMQMSRQSRPGASAEVHTDVEAVRFYRQRKCLLRLPDKLAHFKQFVVRGQREIRYVPGGRYQ